MKNDINLKNIVAIITNAFVRAPFGSLNVT